MSSLVGGRQNELGSHLDVCSTLHVYFEVLGPSHGFGVRNSSSAVVMTTHERPPQARRLRARRAHGALWTMAQGRHNKLPPNQPLPRTPCISPSALDAHGVTVIHALGACRVMTRRAPRSARGAGVPRLAGEVASVFALSSGRAAARTHAIDGVAPRAAHAHHLDGRAVAQRVGSARHDARSRAATRRRALRPRAPPPHRAAAAHAAMRRGERHRARPWSAFRVLRLHARARSHTRAHSKGVRQSSPLRGWLLGVPPQRAAGRPSASARSAQYTPSLLLRCRARVASLRRAAREGGALWHALADTAGAVYCIATYCMATHQSAAGRRALQTVHCPAQLYQSYGRERAHWPSSPPTARSAVSSPLAQPPRRTKRSSYFPRAITPPPRPSAPPPRARGAHLTRVPITLLTPSTSPGTIPCALRGDCGWMGLFCSQ